MNITLERALAQAASHIIRVTDPTDLERISEPLSTFVRSCPFLKLEKRDDDSPFEFKADWACVVTRSDDSKSVTEPSHSVVKFIARSGKEPIRVPTVTLKAKSEGDPPSDPTEQFMEILSGQITRGHGWNLMNLFSTHLLMALIGAAEKAGRVKLREPDSVHATVLETICELGGDCTVLSSFEGMSRFPLDFRERPDSFKLKGGVARAIRSMGKGVMLVVRNDPEAVGFARQKREIETVAGLKDLYRLAAVSTGQFGFCVWGDAPVVKIDFRPEKPK